MWIEILEKSTKYYYPSHFHYWAIEYMSSLSPQAYKWQHFKLCYSVYYIICMYVFNITSEPLTICAKTFEPDYMLENFRVWLLYYNIWTWLNVLKPLNLTIPRPLNLTITIFTILSEPNYIYYNLNLTIYTIWTWLHLL